MPAKITNMKDENGNTLYPVTRTSAVLDANGDNLDIVLAGKQNSLSSSQMDAVNSGINAAKVAQIDTNTTNIANKLDKTNVANQLYGTDGSGNQATFLQGSNVTANAFVKRKSSGQIKVRTNPSEDDEAVGKGYVDTKVNKGYLDLSYYNGNSDATITSGSAIFNNGSITTTGRPIKLEISFYGYLMNGGSGFLSVYVDNVSIFSSDERIFFTHNSAMWYSASCIFSLTSGTHTISFKFWSNTSNSMILKAYNSSYITLVEV